MTEDPSRSLGRTGPISESASRHSPRGISSASPGHECSDASARGCPMNVGTEQEWQEARRELLAAERDLEEHEKRVVEQRRELPWVPGREGVRVRDRGRPEVDARPVRRALAAAHLAPGVRRGLGRCLPGVHVAPRRPGRRGRSLERPRYHPALHVAGTARDLALMRRERAPTRAHPQHLPRLSALAPHHTPLLRARRAAAEREVIVSAACRVRRAHRRGWVCCRSW